MWRLALGVALAGAAAFAADPFASAQLAPKSGTSVTGNVNFYHVETANGSDGLEVVANVRHATPGDHGIHIHDRGDCSAADASSAGPHWNPTSSPHGGPGSVQHHAGDLGNIHVGKDGTGHLDEVLTGIDASKFGGWDMILGHSVVVHAASDDFTTQPAGNSGPRVACGVIGPASLSPTLGR